MKLRLKPISMVLFVCCAIASSSVFLSNAEAGSWNGKIIIPKSHSEISIQDMAMNLVFARNVILGEKHNTPAIQAAQTKVIEAVVGLAPQDSFTTAWEFLNYTDQLFIEEQFEKFSSNEITASQFLENTQGSAKYISYAPILEATKKNHGRLIGVNLSRADKEPVVRGGLANAKPGTVPMGFERGSANYKKRFKVSMDGHATDDQIQNYFDAQCLTDDVIAVQMLNDEKADRRFLVVGSFHSDYFDGTVARLMKRAPEQLVGVVRFVDASDYSESELLSLLGDQQYGLIADFVYVVNEPTTD